MARTALFWLVLAALSSGCIRFYRPGEGGPAVPENDSEATPEEPAKPSFDTEEAKLTAAQKHLEAEEYEEAARLATEVKAMLRQRDDRRKKSNPTCTKLEKGHSCVSTDWDENPWFDWLYAATAIQGLARTRSRDELAGLTALDWEGIDPKRCPSAFSALCEEMEGIQVNEDYVALFERIQREPAGGGSRIKKTGQLASNYYYISIPGMAGYSAESVGYFLEEQVVRRLRKNRRRYGAVWIGNHYEAERTERQQGGRTVYAWKGTTKKVSGTSCRDTGSKVKIGRATFDVQACRKSSHISQAATVTMTLSDEDAAQLDFDAGDAALVIFETNKVGGSKVRLNLGAVRLARVAHKGETLQ